MKLLWCLDFSRLSSTSGSLLYGSYRVELVVTLLQLQSRFRFSTVDGAPKFIVALVVSYFLYREKQEHCEHEKSTVRGNDTPSRMFIF